MNRLAAVLMTVAVVPLLAWADPPGRVARLSLVEGQAAVFADPEQGWEGARVNTSLTSENSVWTEPGARAELRFGSAALRLGETTQLDILRLDDETFRAHVARGSLAVRVRDMGRNESWYVTTPEARFQLRGNGRYRIETDLELGQSRLTVFSGTARLEAAGGSINIDTSRSVRVTGGERPRYEFEPAVSTDLDEWALARDQRLEEREAARYVPQEMTGWEDLDDYGVWRNEAEYGVVWYPTRVEAGWVPYRYGRWTWVRPWGWTWVDDAPWGYAPFHYGRWVYVGNRWGWYPGQYTSRPVWAPALVGWVGGSGWNISISTGLTDVMGWYPLSPFDRYEPWYAANVTYVNRVNHIVIPPRRDRDGRRDDRRGDRDGRRDGRHDNRDRGATVMPREHFGSRRPVQNFVAPVAGEVVARQPLVSGSSVLPSRSEWRMRTKPADATPLPTAPRAPVRGEPAASPRPSSPAAPAPRAPATQPAVITPPAPAVPSSRFARPAPAEPAPRVKPAEPAVQPSRPGTVTRPAAPAEPATRAKPPEARGTESRAPRAVERSAPAQPQPVVRPAPVPTQPAARTAPVQSQPAARTAPVQSQPAVRPAPVQSQPVAKPAPAQERPAARGAPTVEKPGKTDDAR